MEGLTRFRSEDTSQERPGHTPNRMKSKDVQSLVNMDPLVDVLKTSANAACDEPDGSSRPHSNITSSRRNANKTSNSTIASTHDTELSAVSEVVDESPSKQPG